MKQRLKSITEFGPLLIFFATYQLYGIVYATGALVAATIVAVVVTYYMIKSIPMMPLITAVIVGFFGILTIFSGNDVFIKIKPTIVNIIFATILFVGVLRGKGLLKHLFASAIQMKDAAWKSFSLRWAIFFLALAATNEYVWRNLSTDAWVQFKVFGLFGATLLFMLTQIPFIQANMIKEDEKT